MRIVIDMQGAQYAPRMCATKTTAFVQRVIESGDGHEIILALSGLSLDSIENIRAAFQGLIPQENIRVWHAPISGAEILPTDIPVAQKIREAFLASLVPDYVLVPIFHAEFDLERSIISVRAFAEHVPVVAFVDVPSEQFADAQLCKAIAAFYQGARIGQADGILTTSGATDNQNQKIFGELSQCSVTRLDVPLLASDDYLRAAAKQVLAFLDGLHPQNRVPSWDVASKPTMAYLSPLHPERSGISDYSAELLPSLAQHYDIHIISDIPAIEDEWIRSHCKIDSVQKFKECPDQYDRVLYHIGNARFHAHMFELLEQCPGVVVLHDFYLGDVQRYREAYEVAPNAWMRALYESHGYEALRRRVIGRDLDAVGRDYPVNFQVLRDATGVITHSEFSRSLSNEWYDKKIAEDWAVIPHLRVPTNGHDRALSREALGLSHDSFVITSFGFLGPTKLNQILLDAWLKSTLVNDDKCVLVFVGENPETEYGFALEKAIKSSGVAQRIRITGWANTDIYRHYLAASDMSVQLRASSRGETSGTVLDCMNYGIATIVNATGPMAELPQEAVWMLPSDFSEAQLIDALEALYKEPSRRKSLGAIAIHSIQTNYSPSHCAALYRDAIERFHVRARSAEPALIQAVVDSIAAQDRAQEKVLRDVAVSIDRSLEPVRPARTFYLDISATCKTELHTGIERVARALTIALLEDEECSYRVEPVCLEKINGQWVYVRVSQYTTTLLGMPEGILGNAVVQPRSGDIVLGLDICGDRLISAVNEGFVDSLRNDGVRVYFMIHDLLPITLAHTFPPGTDVRHARWLSAVATTDGAICISNAVAKDLKDWLRHNGKKRSRPFFIGVSHHGADVSSAAPTLGLPSDSADTLKAFAKCPTFLMVGTIEPRKGYSQVIDAFTHLWNEGIDVNLVIVGNEGWKGLPNEMRRTIPQTVHVLSTHAERGKHLFWLQGASDEYLEKVYQHSDCLIAASEGEGFGLPLIEGAQHHLPIMARDIPVFREVAGDFAYYFDAESGEELADQVKQWLDLYREGRHPSSEHMPWLTWKESANRALELCTRIATDEANRMPALVSAASEAKARLLIDVSVVYKADFKTGVQRVVRSVLGCLFNDPPQGYEIVPVFLDAEGGPWCYKVAAVYFDGKNITFDSEAAHSAPALIPQHGDILLGLDLAGGHVVNADREGLFKRLRQAGVHVYFVVHDLLPVTMPQFFSPADSAGHEDWLKAIARVDGVICNSEATADDFRHWAANQRKANQPAPSFQIKSFHLGADIGNSSPSTGLPEGAEEVLSDLAARPTFLMVGTIEPRKGHPQVLRAFELLWAANLDVNLAIVGKQGWMTEDFCDRLRKHPEAGRRLFWLNGVSDEYLEKVYASSACLIAASEGEGFGLPLIEAAQKHLPILARDVPVFREVAGDYAFYFTGKDESLLAASIKEWLALYESNQHPKSDHMPWLTWKQSTDQLVECALSMSSKQCG